jgi:RNA polymerase sigma factor (sigma-70 family)
VKLAQEKPGQTLQATALVHEAYLRLVGAEQGVGIQESGNGGKATALEPIPGPRSPNHSTWNSRGHFFAAAAEAMRRIIVERVRSKRRQKRGGDLKRADFDQLDLLAAGSPADDLLAIDEALEKLDIEDPQAARLVKLRFFIGLSLTEAAEALGISRTTAYEQWAYARAWLRCVLEGDEPASPR